MPEEGEISRTEKWMRHCLCTISGVLILGIVFAVGYFFMQYRGFDREAFSFGREASIQSSRFIGGPRGSPFESPMKIKRTSGITVNVISGENLDSNISETSQPHHELELLVHNPSCQILDYPPFHAAVEPYHGKISIICSQLPLISSVTLPNRNSSYILNLHKEHFPLYRTNGTEPDCEYCTVNASMKAYEVEDCYLFNTSVELDPSTEQVLVTCYVGDNETYKNSHILVAIKPEISHKTERSNGKNDTEKVMSVMIIGIDSVSRLSLLRNMPETVSFLNTPNWYPLNVHHKIQYHGYTWSNLVTPVLTGKSSAQLRTACSPSKETALDNCPWIWKNYSERNYITAYGEDGPKMDSFYYNGWLERPPTDYYMRPSLLAAHGTLRVKKLLPLCIGPSTTAKHMLDFSADFAYRFAGRPTFSMFWMNSFSHEYLTGPSMEDKFFKAYWNRMEKSGVLNSTMVLFMSDHGCQREDFRKTYEGSVEDSMPFLYIRLPDWFKEKYPSKVNNLIKNKNRLTSHYDLHVTLMDVLGVKVVADGCPKCVSLFDPVPWNRGCSDAGINESACSCSKYREIPKKSSFVERMAQLVITHINEQIASAAHPKNCTCSKLALENVPVARLVLRRRINHRLDDKEKRMKTCRLMLRKIKVAHIGPHRSFWDSRLSPMRYVIQVVTKPGDAVFEAAILHNVSFTITSLIRLDSHHDCSTCSLINKKYCHCETSQL